VDADGWDERYASTDLVWSATPNQFVERELRDLPPGRDLNLACGEGRNALWLASLGWQVTAVDSSRVAIDKGRAVDASLDWVCADVTQWQALGAYDLVVIAACRSRGGESSTAAR
jgi:2-polyprenyl-3-methyl-5-hydroxy-6-metoxy-1,4-benzoquinol methylase